MPGTILLPVLPNWGYALPQNSIKSIEVLNDLVQINNDRITGYEKAIRRTKPEDDDLEDPIRHLDRQKAIAIK